MTENILNSLEERFGKNFPIFTSDFPNADSDATRQFISRSVKAGKIKRYEKGVYYFPTNTRWGDSLLSPLEVCRRKYISSDGKVYGYISGTNFENEAGFTEQVPNSLTIRTNNTASRKRVLTTGGQKVILKKTRTPVTTQNQKELQFLDLINDMPVSSLERNKEKLKAYCKMQALSKDTIKNSLRFYPSEVSKKIMEEGIYDVLT